MKEMLPLNVNPFAFLPDIRGILALAELELLYFRHQIKSSVLFIKCSPGCL